MSGAHGRYRNAPAISTLLGWEPLYPLCVYVHVHVHISTRSVNREASTAVSDNVDESARLYPAAYLDLRFVCACTCVCVP